MLISVLKSKISYATIVQSELYYVGSITIDRTWMEQANIRENEKVQIVNLNNGARLETYVIPGESGSKMICLNGPAARLGQVGDQIFIISYALIDPDKESVEPVLVDLSEKEH